MSQFVIILNQIQGVDLILQALAERSQDKGCQASADLHVGIMNNLHLLENDIMIPIQPPVAMTGPIPFTEPEPEKKFLALRLVPKKS